MAKLSQRGPTKPLKADWRQTLDDRIALFGHRNWIVVADAAYPTQAREGIETILANTDQIDVVRAVLNRITELGHVRARIYTDQELEAVEEEDAPGISAYRAQLLELLENYEPIPRPHEQIISELDDAGKTFRILVIKTKLRLPYTSVFAQLDCGYWNQDAESRLRAALALDSNETDR